MKRLLTIAFLLISTATFAQDDGYFVDDEECGCELFFIDGIQTTRGSDGLFGFRRADGTEITPNMFKYVDRFHNGYCRVYIDEGQCGLIDRTGREVVPCIYNGMEYPSEGRIVIFRDSHVGYCDMLGHEVITPIYIQGASFSNGCAAVQLDNGLCAFIDTLGNLLFGRTFDNARPFHHRFAAVRENGLWGMIDRDGNIALTLSNASITENTDGLFLAGSVGHMALYDSRMRPLTDFIYSGSLGQSEGLLSVVRNGQYGFVDTTGREVVPCIYDETGLFNEGRALVRKGDRYGIVDTAGHIILPIEYDNSRRIKGFLYTYYDGRALVEKDGHVSFVDLYGQPIMPFVLDDAYHFSNGLAAVKKDGAWGYINTSGEIYMPFIFDLASPYSYGRAEVVFQGHVSKVDLKGRCVKNCNGIIAWREWNE